jgi:hypothetical protein
MTLGQRIRAVEDLGCNAIELSFLKCETSPSFELCRDDASADSLDSFLRVSLHAPMIKCDQSEFSVSVLKRLLHLQQDCFDRGIGSVIFHPDTIVDFGMIVRTPFYIGGILFENMDSRKQSFKGTEEMEYLLKFHPSFNICLDVNHAFDNDVHSLCPDSLAEKFLKLFRPRIKQVHLSGYNNGHVPLFKVNQDRLILQAFNTGAAIIIESVVESWYEMKLEYEYVIRKLAALERLTVPG